MIHCAALPSSDTAAQACAAFLAYEPRLKGKPLQQDLARGRPGVCLTVSDTELLDIEHVCMLCPVQPFATPWTVGHQASLSMEFFTQSYWSELPFSPPGIFPIQRSNLSLLPLLHQQADT